MPTDGKAEIRPEHSKVSPKDRRKIPEPESPHQAIKNAQESNAQRARSILGTSREDFTGWVQKVRGKENIKYTTTEREGIFAKSVANKEGKRDDIAGLKNEKQILEKLVETGVTPKVGEIKVYPNGERAKLLMETVVGNPLDSGEMNDQDFKSQHAQDVVFSTANAMETIHRNNVLVIDVNSGTFVIDKEQEAIETKVVDFELGVDLDQSTDEDLYAALKYLQRQDRGLSPIDLHGFKAEQLPDILRKSEIHRWAKTMSEWMLGPSHTWKDIEIPTEKQLKYQAEEAKIKPLLESEIAEQARRQYDKLQDGLLRDEGVDKYVENELAWRLPLETREALLSMTLGERLKAAGIELPDETVDFLEKALSTNIDERPSSFDNLFTKEYNKVQDSHADIRPLYRGLWAEKIKEGDRIAVGGSIFSEELDIILEVDTGWMEEKMKTFTRERVDEVFKSGNEEIFKNWLEGNGINIDPETFHALLQVQTLTDKLLKVGEESVAIERKDHYLKDRKAKLSEFIGKSECAEQAVVGKLLLDKIGIKPILMEGVHVDGKNHDPLDHSFLIIDDPQGEGSLIFDIARPKASIKGYPRILRANRKLDFSTFEGKNNYVIPVKDIYNGTTLYYGVGHSSLLQDVNFAES